MEPAMRSPYTQLYLHYVWSTWDRLHLLTPDVEQPVYAAIHAKCKELKCQIVAIGGMPDHVHLLVRLHTTVSVANFIKDVKGSTSHLVTHKIRPGDFFRWQGAYGAFTVSKDGLPTVMAYVERQKEHHRDGDCWQEWELTEIMEGVEASQDLEVKGG
jgi:REP element-mobilizing transposase RayT